VPDRLFGDDLAAVDAKVRAVAEHHLGLVVGADGTDGVHPLSRELVQLVGPLCGRSEHPGQLGWWATIAHCAPPRIFAS